MFFKSDEANFSINVIHGSANSFSFAILEISFRSKVAITLASTYEIFEIYLNIFLFIPQFAYNLALPHPE